MRPPSPATWLIGNSVVSLVLMVGGVAVVGMWLMGMANGWAAFGAAMVASLAAQASEKVRAHAAWEREWRGGGSRGIAMPRGLRFVFSAFAWCGLAWLSLMPNGGDPAMALASGLFWIASAVMAMVAIVRLFRRQRGRRGSKAVPVAVCLGVPIRSPSLKDAYAALPPR